MIESFQGLITADSLSALLTVLMADLVLAGDNAIIVGMAAAGLPADLRRRAIFIGIIAATGLRIVFAAVAVQLLAIIGLTLAGGLLLLWVAWKLFREIRGGLGQHEPVSEVGGVDAETSLRDRNNFRSALIKIVVADVSMSLDNVLAVAGAARDHLWVMIVGLMISVALTGAASSLIARLLGRHRWVAYVGLFMIAYIAVRMIWDGTHEVLRYVG